MPSSLAVRYGTAARPANAQVPDLVSQSATRRRSTLPRLPASSRRLRGLISTQIPRDNPSACSPRYQRPDRTQPLDLLLLARCAQQ
jgi:hypothetical protein